MTIQQSGLEQLLGESRKRGYVRRAELEAALQRTTSAAQPATRDAGGTHASLPENDNDEISRLRSKSWMTWIRPFELFLAHDVDIVDDDEEAARAQEDEDIESSIHTMETESAPLVDLPDESEVERRASAPCAGSREGR